MRPSVREVLKVAELIGQANTALGRVYEILINSNQTGRRFDYTIVPAGNIGLDHLLMLVKKIERLYFQERMNEENFQ